MSDRAKEVLASHHIFPAPDFSGERVSVDLLSETDSTLITTIVGGTEATYSFSLLGMNVTFGVTDDTISVSSLSLEGLVTQFDGFHFEDVDDAVVDIATVELSVEGADGTPYFSYDEDNIWLYL